MSVTQLSRRGFLKSGGLAATGLVLGFNWSEAAPADPGVFEPNAFIQIDPESGVTLHIPIPEIGQNIRTTLAMILADELGANLDTVRLQQAPPSRNMGRQNTAGSGSVRAHFMPLRQAGAAAREMLIAAASAEWKLPATGLKAAGGEIVSQNGDRMPLHGFASAAAALPVPQNPVLMPTDQFRYIGKARRCLDTLDLVTGRTIFGIDAFPENLHFAVMLRPPVLRGKLKRYDATEAEAMPGVKAVLKTGQKIAVIATNTWTAINASRLVQVEWDNGALGKLDSEMLDADRRDHTTEAKVASSQGAPGEQFAQAAVQVEAGFDVPSIAHATLEPPNCTAWFHDGVAEIWGSCQVLSNLQNSLPRFTGLPRDRIVYHQLRIGGGFGRKLQQDYVQEAIEIAQQVPYPVKLTFTREDDLRHDRYRGMSNVRFKAGVAKNGYPISLLEHRVYSHGGSSAGALSHIFPHYELAARKMKLPYGTGALRAPGHNVSCFVEQCMLDCVAESAKLDPIDYRLALLGDAGARGRLGWTQSPQDEPDLVEVLKLVRERSGWRQDEAYGYGIATFSGYGSHCALVALAPKKQGKRPIEKVYAVVNCGRVINPLGAHAQIEGGIVDCLGATLHQKVDVKDGKVVQSNFHDFPLLQISESPEIDVHLIESDGEPQGLGEVSYPPMAAATACAISEARGRRITDLPIFS